MPDIFSPCRWCISKFINQELDAFTLDTDSSSFRADHSQAEPGQPPSPQPPQAEPERLVPAARRLVTPGVPVDEGEKSFKEKPDFSCSHNRPCTTLLLSWRYNFFVNLIRTLYVSILHHVIAIGLFKLSLRNYGQKSLAPVHQNSMVYAIFNMWKHDKLFEGVFAQLPNPVCATCRAWILIFDSNEEW